MKTTSGEIRRSCTRLPTMCSLPQPCLSEPLDGVVVEEHDAGNGLRLALFQSWHAWLVARWVHSAEQLRWLAPSTPGPLTAERVLAWKRPAGEAFVLTGHGDQRPIAYGEVNPMRNGDGHVWLGHVIVRPDRRGRGLGTIFVRALVAEAFERRGATRVSLIVFPDNLAAMRCYERVGFTRAGTEYHQFSGSSVPHRLLRLEITRTATFA